MRATETCEKIVRELLKEGFKHQVTRKDLEKAIMLTRECVDERTIERWIHALQTFTYLQQESSVVFKLNPLKIPELFQMLKDKPQTKIE